MDAERLQNIEEKLREQVVIVVSVVSISTLMLSELSLGVMAITNLFGRRHSQLASQICTVFGGGGEGCGTTFTQSNTLVASSH
jgi:hypothetical protein